MSTIVSRIDSYLSHGTGPRRHLTKGRLAVEVAVEADCKIITIEKSGVYVMNPAVPNNKVLILVASAPLEVEITRSFNQIFSFTLVGFFVFPDSLETIQLTNLDEENSIVVELIHG